MSKLVAGQKMQAVSGATKRAIQKVYEYAEPNLTLVGWFGLIGFPTYYYVWSYLFPQPYESALLRAFCSMLFLVLVIRNLLPLKIYRFMPVFYLVMLSLCLPFFFSFMMFKNGWNTIWAMSFLCSIFLHILLVHQTRIVLLQATAAISLAFFSAYGLDITQAANEVVWAYVPIFMFTYVFGNLFYFRNQAEHESKVSIAKSFGAGIAHEMRNPLSALKASIEVINSIVTRESEPNSKSLHLSQQDIAMVRDVLNEANNVIENGNEAIDLLLTSIDQSRVSTSTFKKYSIGSVIENALTSFAYKGRQDKQAIDLNVEHDFSFFGSDTLVKYALFNLLKNAFYYQEGNDFKIEIRLQKNAHYNQLIFTDNGAGIPPEVIRDVFDDFYTYGKKGGSGLGLPFCKKVMMALGGKITCRSELGLWTEFTLSFPVYESDRVDRIKMDLLKSKSVLYIGSDDHVSRTLNEHAFYKGFSLISVDIETAVKKEEYEFEYDLIFIDLDTSLKHAEVLATLESKLHFTQAKLVYLYNANHQCSHYVAAELTVYPVEKKKMAIESGLILDELFFESPKSKSNLVCCGTVKKADYQGKTIVLADDNHSVRTYTAMLLEQQGFVVIEAKDGNEVLHTLNSQYADLVLMDLEMPNLNGLEAADRIRHSKTEYANIPILAHTGDDSLITLEQIKESGINDYIAKPAGTETLLGKITNWV